MDRRGNLKFVIVGHVDHGKSTLIGRLLFDTDSLPPDKMQEAEEASRELGHETEFAYLMDSLREEREQGITIDTTQIFFNTDKRNYVIIDAPGHVEFVKNMITGASQADAAFLIVDAHEGVREQTKRHAYILAMLGLEQVIVLMNKMDLLDFDEGGFDGVRKEVERFLGSIGVKMLHCIPISAMKGDNVAGRSKNMDWYDGPTVLQSLDSLKNRPTPENQPLIFPTQDVYKVDGKRIAVGRVETGAIQKGQTIKILPGGQVTTVRSIEKFLEDVDKSSAGESTGITTTDPVFLNRGDVICEPGKEPPVTHVFKASVFWMSKIAFDKKERVILRCATQEITCVIEKIGKRIHSSTLEVIEEDSDRLENLEVGEVLIETKKPIAIKTFNDAQELGRFVLIRNEDVCAGGIVTDTQC